MHGRISAHAKTSVALCSIKTKADDGEMERAEGESVMYVWKKPFTLAKLDAG